MQNQRHMWRTARKSDYGTGAAGVVFLCKKGGLLWKTVTILVRKK